MNNKSIPVYLDCNYDDINNAISKLSDLEIKTSSTDLLNCITGELKERYNGELKQSEDDCKNHINSIMSSLRSRMKNSLETLEEFDSSMLEALRDYVERALNYTAPIDRNEYPHLTDEMIDQLYDYILESSGKHIYSNYPEFEGLNQRLEALNFLLSRCNLEEIPYSRLKDVYINANSDERQRLYDRLQNVSVLMPACNKLNDIDIEEFDEIINILESNNDYDEDTVCTIVVAMHIAKRNFVAKKYHRETNSQDELISLSFGDLNIDIEMSKLLDYCTADTFVRPVTFNYYGLFSDYISSDISGDSRVKFNLNGVDFDLSVEQLKEAMEMVDTKKYILDFTNRVSANDAIQTRFMGCLCKLLKYNSNEGNDKKSINVYGRKINVSLNELFKCLDDDGDVNVEKLINCKDLSELERVRFKNLLPFEDSYYLRLSDLNIEGHGKALDFFYKYGSISQTDLNEMGLYHVGEEETERLIHFCMDKYGFNEDEAYLIMRSIGRRSGCTGVDACNAIYELYDYDADKFQEDFGYPMLIKKQMDDGEIHDILNGNQLWLDAIISSTINSGTGLLNMDDNGKIIINNEYLEQNKSGTQTFLKESMFYYNEFGDDFLNQFLKENNNDILDNYSSVFISANSRSNFSDNQLHDILVSAINDNKIVSAIVGCTHDYEMYQIDSLAEHTYSEGDSHAVTVSGITEEGVLVNSWGSLYYMPFDSFDVFRILKNNNESGGGV